MTQVPWTDLLGRSLKTATGAPFTVVRVTARHVAVRPQAGKRDYAVSIAHELEPALAVLAQRRLPPPADLRALGIRPVFTSYAWGLLKAVLDGEVSVRTARRATLKDFAGDWVIMAMDEMDEEYWAAEPGPAIRLRAQRGGGLTGEYEIGLSTGRIEGGLREFSGQAVVVFGYDGMDEMDPTSGGGWLQLLENGTLEGEFMGGLGSFVARRRAKTSRRTSPKKMVRL